MKPERYSYEELICIKVISGPKPTVEQIAEALLFRNDYSEGKRNHIVTSKPYIWAAALEFIRKKAILPHEVIEAAKELRKNLE